MSVDFSEGELVLCVNDDFSMRHFPGVEWPKFGKVYRVRKYVAFFPVNMLVVHEIVNHRIAYQVIRESLEAGFWEKRFISITPEEKKIMEGELAET